MLEGSTPWPEEFARQYIRQGYWEAKSLADLLEERARAFPGRVFVSDGDRKLTFKEVNRLADVAAFHLLDRGLKSRDIVLLQFPNIWEFVVVFFALQKIGVIPVMCLPPHRHAELTYFAQLTGARGYFFPQRFRNFGYLSMAKEVQAVAPRLEYLITPGDGSETGVSYLGEWLDQPMQCGDLADMLAPFRSDPFDVAF
jgi:2,3-dihydroxybenzoate-AMP ligase